MPRSALLLAALTVVALAACDEPPRRAAPPAPAPAPTASTAPAPIRDAAAEPTPEPADAARPTATAPTPTTTAPTPAAAGPAYLGVDSVGLMKLDAGTLTTLIPSPYGFKAIAVDGAGTVYAAGIAGTWQVARGRKPVRLDAGTSLPFEAIALGPDGVLWGTDHQGVFRYDGAWTSEPGSTFDNALLLDLAVDLDGRVWVVTSDALWRLDGDRWNKLDTGFARSRTPYFDAIAAAPDGSVYVASLPGTFRFRDGRWRDAGMRTEMSLDELVAGPAGHVVGSGGVGELVIVTPGHPVRRLDVADAARARRGDLAAVDAAGRSWITTDNGLVILDEDGALLQQWKPGTVAGVTGPITAVATAGAGPSLPALQPAAVGTITGKVLRGGKSVAGATVQLCDLPLTMFERTPCEGSSFVRTATTAADGTFRMDGVPVGGYGFAVKPGKTWLVFFGRSACCTALEAGATYDIGAITVD